jgi:hypothetical protein
MSTSNERIPIPWPQRWELIRERLLPAVCFVATIAACAWLWRYNTRIAPNGVGEVHAAAVEIKSPCNGQLLPLSDSDNSQWSLFDNVKRDATVARVLDQDHNNQIVEVTTPLSGAIASKSAIPGQLLRRGDPILKVIAQAPDYILCHLATQWQSPPAVGSEVAIRPRGHGNLWYSTVVEAVGPAVELAPTAQGMDATVPSRGLPVRLALPKDIDLTPGSVVEIRFPPGSKPL